MHFVRLLTCACRLVDTLLAIWILLILACGVHGMLWQAALIQHWIKSSGCDQVKKRYLQHE